MKKAANEMKLGDDWKAALARVKADYVPPGQQDELVARIAREATDFVKRRDLVTVPRLCEESWGLTMISPETLKTIPYAAYNGRQMMVAYANGEMKQDDKLMVMRGNNRHFTRLVIPHELIPGHHLQIYYASRGPERPFSTPFYVEGWALYWELRLWDLGWAQTPEDRIGMLFWRMTRSARVILTLKYHLGRMTPEEMVTFLVDRVGHEKLGARSEVRRFIQAEPLYQVGYLIGGRQILALHDEMAGPGKLSERQFHDAVLQAGSDADRTAAGGVDGDTAAERRQALLAVRVPIMTDQPRRGQTGQPEGQEIEGPLGYDPQELRSQNRADGHETGHGETKAHGVGIEHVEPGHHGQLAQIHDEKEPGGRADQVLLLHAAADQVDRHHRARGVADHRAEACHQSE